MDAAPQSIVDSSNFGEMSQWFDEQSAMTKELGSEYEGLGQQHCWIDDRGVQVRH